MTILGCCEWCLGGSLAILGLLTAFWFGWTAHHRPALRYPVNRDVTAADPRPVPPVMPPPALDAHYTPRLGQYGPDILDIPHGARTARVFPYCDWQGTIQDRRN